MEGTIVNAMAVTAGGLAGVALRHRFPERVRETVMAGIGLATLLIGFQMALQTGNVLIVIASLVLGGIIGEAIHIEEGIEALGRWAERMYGSQTNENTVAAAFVTSSLLFCVGPMTVLGAIQDGLGQTPVLLYTKSLLDGISAVAIGAALGVGVLLSAGTVLLYQGALTLAAGAVHSVMTQEMTRELTATGGALIIGLGLGILRVRKVRVGNMLPALVISVLLTAALPYLRVLTRAVGL
ncbi:MAG: DUF554 domain-containing protein [Armatimonadetes bacterium]|nr:DUF554 domain-containing protein [Armatimonadota bacterium]